MNSFFLFADPNVVFMFNLGLSLLVGLAIGIERESRGKDAGISTHSLVIMGSMLFTYLSMQVDPESTSRIAAQVVTGIGFLGAGLILKEGTSVRNLTTAASLWFAAAIGMAIGFQFYIAAILSTLVALLALRIPHIIEPDKGVLLK
jgi:putative Mg2+ transporter-C (MgtC) family protein